MLDLVLVLHCHQPVGNFHHVFELAHEKCYRPLLELLDAHPSIQAGLHFSGPLLEWLEQYRPDSLDLLGKMIEREQIEPLSGGFYEPLLPTIPAGDARGQVLMMNEYLARRFGRRPRGFWLTERIWDSTLPMTLADSGLSYTIVDDTHFLYAGLRQDQIYGRYITEKEGHTLNLLATPMIMRYLIPFRLVEDVISHLRGMEQSGRSVAVYGDDGEKFGLWPGTHEWVIQKKWLETFLTAIEQNSDWLRTVRPESYVASSRPLGRLYLPPASYEEMTEWALPEGQGSQLDDIIAELKKDNRWDRWRPFIRGGIWDNFLVKYDEANWMHKKMLFLSPMAEADRTARDYLWRAQCNCAYWHGIFGGLYLGHLRRAIHENLIRAEKSLMARNGEAIKLHRFDFDRDGAEEILVRGPELSLGLDPGKGGGLFELSHMDLAINLCDTMTRRREAYHRRLLSVQSPDNAGREGVPSIHEKVLVKEEGLERLLIYDAYTRTCLLDHFLEPGVDVHQYFNNQYRELGDFIQGKFEVGEVSVEPDSAGIEFTREGRVGQEPISVTKKVSLGPGAGLKFDYLIENHGPGSISALYGCEFNLTLFSDKDPGRYYHAPEWQQKISVPETGRTSELTRFDLVNESEGWSLNFLFSRPISVWFYPLKTVSMSEEGFESTYQGSSLLIVQPLNLAVGENSRLRMEMRFERL